MLGAQVEHIGSFLDFLAKLEDFGIAHSNQFFSSRVLHVDYAARKTELVFLSLSYWIQVAR